MAYSTFVSSGYTWRLFSGIGDARTLVLALDGRPVLHDASAAVQPVVWVCGRRPDHAGDVVQRVALPSLRAEELPPAGNRVGAIASSPQGDEAVALTLPTDLGDMPSLRRWHGGTWQDLPSPVAPDISSKVAWIDGHRIAFESAARRLTVLDVDAGTAQSGPPGALPAAAVSAGAFYAAVAERVCRFSTAEPFSTDAQPVDAIAFGTVTSLRVTHDGNVFTWTEPRGLLQSKYFTQERTGQRSRLRDADEGFGIVVGPYAETTAAV